MTNTKKITYYINSFDSAALKSLKLFIASPFFNKKDDLQLLLQHFTKTKTIDYTDIDAQDIYKKLYPNKPFNERKIQRELAYFLQLIEQFITHYDLQNDKATHHQKLMEYCNDIAFYSRFEILLGKSEQSHSSKKVTQHTDYLNYYNLLIDKYYYLSINNAQHKKEHEIYDLLNKASQNLDKYYIINKLRFIAISLNQKNIINNTGDSILSDEILDLLEKNQYLKQTPLINAFYNVVMFLMDYSNEENFHSLQSMLKQDTFKGIPHDEKLLYDFAINYCAFKINSGNSQYYESMFELHKQVLQTEIFYIDGYLFNDTIKNIVTIALRLNKLDWTENFLNEYRSKFKPDEREDIFNYNIAHLKFYRNEYQSSLEHLRATEYRILYFKFVAKALFIKNYYELNEDPLLTSEIEAFYALILRSTKKFSDQFLNLYKNFISILREINTTPKFEKEKLQKTLTRIGDTQLLAERMWLEGKVKEKLD